MRAGTVKPLKLNNSEPGVAFRAPPRQPSPLILAVPFTLKPLSGVNGKGLLNAVLTMLLTVELLLSVILKLVGSPGKTVALFGATGPVLTVTEKCGLVCAYTALSGNKTAPHSISQ